MSILTENYIVKNVRAYPVLREKFMAYMKGVKNLPEGFRENKLFHDYLKVRRNNPEKRVSQSEYMIFGFYNLSTGEQKKYLTDVEATRLMRPYNNDSEPYLKSKATFLKNFTRFIHRGWLYVPKASYEEFCDFLHKYRIIALKPQYSSWGIGFFKLTEEEFASKEDPKEFYQKLCEGRYLAEEFVQSCKELAAFHPSSLNTLRVITFRNGDRFEVFGGGLRVGNNGLCVDNAHGGGIFCEIDPESGKIITDGLDEYSNSYVTHPMTGVPFKGMQIPRWKEVVELCKEASKELPCLRVVGWDVAILEDGTLELIEGNHSPGMNIVQAPAKHGVYERFSSMLLDYYGEPDQYVTKQSA
ncbi:sugar-transfer associated ATP-grasp domain-containing protein [Mordavella massiliensis]|uniref:sugar-transfer associated ATP-grasp domain-containing protein n=1 Tax=Mordavella massiliensis TaxID=1871024 RepID=UPI002109CEEE|nr:hypothetical protein [Mordavella massiliensis]